MKTNKRVSSFVLAAAIITTGLAHSAELPAVTTATDLPIAGKSSHTPQWSVQVKMIDPGDVGISASFQIGIYESILDELNKTKRFKQVLRDGVRTSNDIPDLLILRTKVEKYAAGSETQRAVTTVSGATKLTVRSQLCTRDGQIVFEREVRGEVLFMGGNLRATHNLARNVAKTIKQSALPVPAMPVLAQSDRL